MSPRIAIIGSGPTGIYTLKGLVHARTPLDISVFEAGDDPGRGTPYHPDINDPAMLSNIASIEIPPITETLVEWLERQSDARLAEMQIARAAIDIRAFYPRLVLGDYFRTQFLSLLEIGAQNGHRIEVHERHRVIDIALQHDDIRLAVRAEGEPDASDWVFDHVVMATGHNWPEHTETKPGYFISPWPATALSVIRNCKVGILGTSLSGIDALMTVATAHGAFYFDAAGEMQYQPSPDTDAFHATMMSRKGLLPEADFYCPLPYIPPRICTADAIDALIATGRHDLLDDVFELFRAEMFDADPEYSARIGLADLTVETIAEAYFAERLVSDPFVWAAKNLAETEHNKTVRYTVPWRYAILRMHEEIARVVPHLDERDLKRFHRYFKTVFVDDYAAVPPTSIARLLALHRAGKLAVTALGEDYEITTQEGVRGVTVRRDGDTVQYDAFIDATGQHSMSATDLPFPTLIAQGGVRKAMTPAPQDGLIDEDHAPLQRRTGGIDIDETFRPVFTDGQFTNHLYCAAISFLLHKLPFVQGITSAAEIGETVAEAILDDVGDTAKTGILLSA
ncbi:FAD/NAD(P)-binding protein [Rhizobium halophytocola]|uniref:NAD(P)/FAD-binding protein YdhS n=1 Tax=Rhizobium halophytocola TaxID=735519 RepID=A0ABS4E5Q4_9HYPH|nr:FAD/NAD(P)-binding protein [Rhizobium halophytocola]MBP1853238.1 putative NAD(P)/FAD-binding protein YdhS [Rhizobium halophytocola]